MAIQSTMEPTFNPIIEVNQTIIGMTTTQATATQTPILGNKAISVTNSQHHLHLINQTKAVVIATDYMITVVKNCVGNTDGITNRISTNNT